MSKIETLAFLHQDANIPEEPYCGVATLFNADVQRILKDREDWIVESPYVITEKEEAKQARAAFLRSTILNKLEDNGQA